MHNPLFWSKAREIMNNRLFDVNTNYITPDEFITFMRLDIQELKNILEDQEKNKKLL